MPYIGSHLRQALDDGEIRPDFSGELNYVISRICKQYMEDKGDSYQAFNDVIGVLEGAKLEFYRRKVAPYEDLKREENGDI